MHPSSWLLIAALLAPPGWGQTPGDGPASRTWYIPALAYGPDIWSIVRLTNPSSAVRPVKVNVYREDGTSLPIAPTFEVQAGAALDIRIDTPSATDEMCWAKVAVLENGPGPAVEVEGFIEILEGKAVEEFPRQALSPLPNRVWVGPASGVEGKQLYFLNVADQPTEVAFCAVDQAPSGACRKKGPSARFLVRPNQSVSLQVRKLRRRYFVTESSSPGAAILVLFADAPGTKRVFASKSSIQFGDLLP